MTTYTLTPSVAGLKYQAKQTENGAAVFVKNAVIAYKLTSSACTQITDIDYPSGHTYALTSLTSVTTTATATTTAANSLVTGDTVVIAGATPSAYNGTYVITVTTPGSVFTYVFAGGTSPATGTKTATGGGTTVPGAVYLDGYMFVQKITGEICNSDAGDITSWNALAFITPEKEPSNAVAIAKSLNYLAAFKQWDTEFFYAPDPAPAPPASPLSPVASAYLKLGCATADSIVEFDGGIVFMSKRDNSQRSREIHVLNGLTPKKISDANVERLLNGDDLATCYACYLSTAGHQFYTLVLKTSGICIVYDFGTGMWYQWTMLTAQAAQTLVAGNLTQSGGLATCILTAHGFADGDPVLMAGATPTDYNGTVNISFVDVNTFTYPVLSTASTPATGTITATGYDESYFPAVAYASYQNLDLILHETNGIIYALDPDTFKDDAVPLNVHIRLIPWDAGTNAWKQVKEARIEGDLSASNTLLRYSDDDHGTFHTYRPYDMSVETSQITRLGQTKKRIWELRHTADTAFRVTALDIEVTKGQ